MDQCYICGETANEKEHVPPKFMSPESSDDIFDKIPVCSTCNRSFSHDESKFRDMVAVSAAYWNPAANDAYQAALRNFRRNSEKLKGKPNRDLLRIQENLIPANIEFRDGRIAGQTALIKHPSDVDSNKIAVKIARGLHYVHTKERFSEEYEMKGYWPNTNQEIIDLIHSLPIRRRYGNFFHYVGGISLNGDSVWLMSFYNKVTLGASFIKK